MIVYLFISQKANTGLFLGQDGASLCMRGIKWDKKQVVLL